MSDTPSDTTTEDVDPPTAEDPPIEPNQSEQKKRNREKGKAWIPSGLWDWFSSPVLHIALIVAVIFVPPTLKPHSLQFEKTMERYAQMRIQIGELRRDYEFYYPFLGGCAGKACRQPESLKTGTSVDANSEAHDREIIAANKSIYANYTRAISEMRKLLAKTVMILDLLETDPNMDALLTAEGRIQYQTLRSEIDNNLTAFKRSLSGHLRCLDPSQDRVCYNPVDVKDLKTAMKAAGKGYSLKKAAPLWLWLRHVFGFDN